MKQTISMDKAGRIVIPRAVRQALGADGQTRFVMEVVLDRIELTPQRERDGKSRVVRKHGMWLAAATGKPFDAAQEVLRERAERVENR